MRDTLNYEVESLCKQARRSFDIIDNFCKDIQMLIRLSYDRGFKQGYAFAMGGAIDKKSPAGVGLKLVK